MDADLYRQRIRLGDGERVRIDAFPAEWRGPALMLLEFRRLRRALSREDSAQAAAIAERARVEALNARSRAADRAEDAEQLMGYLADTLDRVLTGACEADVADAIAKSARTMLLLVRLKAE